MFDIWDRLKMNINTMISDPRKKKTRWTIWLALVPTFLTSTHYVWSVESIGFIFRELMKEHTMWQNCNAFCAHFWSTLLMSDLTTQQNIAKTSVVKVCSNAWGLMCECQPSPDSFTSEACSVCECFCVGCLNSPLFSLLILAAAACEAWIMTMKVKC